MKIFLKIIGTLVLLILVLVIFVQLSWKKTHDAPYPDIVAITDSSVIELGRYLVYSPSHCASCHIPKARRMEVEMGAELPLAGGWELHIPPGIMRAANITMDIETGIGRYTDAEIARVLRYSVGPGGQIVMPFMTYQDMSDEDLTAVVSFLRAQEPVYSPVEKTELSFMGRALMAFGAVKPVFPGYPLQESVPRVNTATYGKYVSDVLANCLGCHTERDGSGGFGGPLYAGRMLFEADDYSNGYAFVSPNITPDPQTGVMASWPEQQFLARFRVGRLPGNSPLHYSPMPWGAYSRMTELDLTALYKYLHSLEPVNNEVEETFFQVAK